MLKTLATVIYPALVQQTNALADAQSRLHPANDFSTGFRKLLDFKDAQGDRSDTKHFDTTYATAFDLLNRMLDQIERSKANPSNVALQYDTAEGEKKLADYFRKFYPDIGEVRDLLKDLAEFRKREAQKAERDDGGFTPADEARLTKAVEKSTSSVTVRLGGYLLNLQESIRKLEAEREALKRERQAATTATKTATRTPLPAPAPPTATVPLTLIFKAGGLP